MTYKDLFKAKKKEADTETSELHVVTPAKEAKPEAAAEIPKKV